MDLYQKKELKVLSIPKHSITSEASVLLKIEIRNSVLLEITGNTHSPYLADYSACVTPAPQKDSIYCCSQGPETPKPEGGDLDF